MFLSSKRSETCETKRLSFFGLDQGKKQYLIKWKGYSDAENTWEDEDNILVR
jgi:hypothetical protein